MVASCTLVSLIIGGMSLFSRQLHHAYVASVLCVVVSGVGSTASAQTGDTSSTPTVSTADYDANRNGLIEVSSLEQLNAIRWDLDGDGVPTRAGAASYAVAFPNTGGVVCRTTTTATVSCKGYELVSDLDFNTGDPSTRTDDLYYNDGAGWEPIGTCRRRWCSASDSYAATFRGNGHVVHSLFIRRLGENFVGLFDSLGNGSRIEEVSLRDVSVEGREYVGGLVGAVPWDVTDVTISTSHVTGMVSGTDYYVGGLVGFNSGEIVASYATGTVSGTGEFVGGLVGRNDGEIVASYATGAVGGTNFFVGGLVGQNYGKIAASYATGAVRGTNFYVGGLVGRNSGKIATSYATGAVSGGMGDVGGFVGRNSGKIAASYATGAVSASGTGLFVYVGGLVGGNMGEIAASYATGAVSWSGTGLFVDVGGLVGYNYILMGDIAVSYWDTLTSGRGSSDGGTGKKTFELRSPTTYTGIYAAWNVDVDGDGAADAPWDFGTSTQYPTLRHGHGAASVALQRPSQPVISADGSLRGLSVGGATLSPDFRAAVTSYDAASEYDVVTVTALVADAGARATISPEDAQSDIDGHQVRLAAGTTDTVTITVTVTAADGSATEYVVVVGHGDAPSPLEDTAPAFEIAATTLTYTAGASVDQTLPAARDGDGELRYRLTNAGSTPTLTLPSGLEFDAATRRLHGRLTTASSSARYTLTATDGDGNLSPADAARMSIAIIVSPDHDANRNGLIEISSLEQLNAIRWDLDGNGVPTRAGAVSYAAAFPNAGGVVCRTTTGTVSCKGYELISDLDFNTGDEGTRTDDLYYNNGAGWEPISACDRPYSYPYLVSCPGYAATFSGSGHVIYNLFIQRPREKYIGLFGVLMEASKIEGVKLRDVSVVGGGYVGGLAGSLGTDGGWFQSVPGGEITDSYAAGKVSGEYSVGGLVGFNNGDIAASYAMVSVSATEEKYIGGFVGINLGDIAASHATGAVSGTEYVGGLVGLNKGEIAASYATGAVSGRDAGDIVWSKTGEFVGGLVGYNWRGGRIASSYATGAVNGTDNYVGGLAGHNSGDIASSYATGAVNGTDNYVGGLVGISWGGIIASYATGAVGGKDEVGGLVGYNWRGGRIASSYATGAVNGTDYVGGLVGFNRGEIASSYATGAVSGTDYVGGLVGDISIVWWWLGRTVTASYWDTLTSGLERSDGGTGKKTFELRSPTTYTGIYAAWNVDVDGDRAADAPWDFGTETQYPILRHGHGTASVALQQSAQPVISADGSLRGLSVDGATLSPDFRAAVTSYRVASEYDVVTVTALVANAGARAEISPKDAQSDVDGHQVRLAAGTTSTITVTVTAADGSATEYVVVVSHEGAVPPLEDTAPVFDVAATTLTYMAGASVDETLPAARGGDGELRYRLTDAGLTNAGSTPTLVLALAPGLEFDAASRRLYGRLTTASSSARYTLTATDGDGNLSPADAARTSIAIVVLPDHDANRNGLIEVSSLEQLNAIRWDLDGDGVPARAGATSYTAAFPNTGGVVCRTTTMVSCKGYELVSDLDFNTGDPGTRTDDLYYNNGAGWEPIGVCDRSSFIRFLVPCPGYAATFSGNGHVIYNLFIRRPGEDYIGLFGVLMASKIEEVGLRDVSVVGNAYVGGLAGHLRDAVTWRKSGLGGEMITASYVTGAVRGTGWHVGGLVGENDGKIASSYAAGSVSGADGYVGGLVGLNGYGGEIASSYATGTVSGTESVVGGLVGGSWGKIVASYSYATGATSRRETGGWYELISIGGLVGKNGHTGKIVASYATGAVSGAGRFIYVGGLAGVNNGGITASYWDTLTSGRGSSAGGTGKKTSELHSPTTYTGIYAAWNVDVDGDGATDAPWDFGTSTQYPTLRYGHGAASVALQRPSQPVISADSGLRGLSVGGTTLRPDFRAAVTLYHAVSEYDVVTVTAVVADAGARAEISPEDAQSDVGGHQVRLATGAVSTVTVTVTAADGSATEYVVMIRRVDVAPLFDVAATTLTYVAGASVDETLPAARGGDGELRYALTDAELTDAGSTRTLTLPPGLEFDATARRLHGRLTTASSMARYTLTATDGDGNLAPSDAARMSIAIVVLPDHDANRNGLIEISNLEQLNAIRWDLDGDGVPTEAGAAPYAAAFPSTGGVVCRTTTATVSCKGYELMSDLDFNTGDANTRTDDLYYDDGAGWEPIGTCDGTYECHAFDPGYAATFRGNGHVIRNLLIRRPDERRVGLFGYLAGGSRIEEVGLRGVHVEGRKYVGGLAGQSGVRYATGTAVVSIGSSYATGVVSGTSVVGGLAGWNLGGEITASYAAGMVYGGDMTGGLVGVHERKLTASSATATVGGRDWAGGLVGSNEGEITASYATGAVGGRDNVGGLVGYNWGRIAAGYATGAVGGRDNVGGFVGGNPSSGEIVASYATGVAGGRDEVGGLVGHNWGRVAASYATGKVSGERFAGGFVGHNHTWGAITAGYWDTLASGLAWSDAGTGKKTFELRSPTTYTGIYAAWNVDVDSDGAADAPWDFGTSTQYPTLRYGHGAESVALQRPSQPVISADSGLRGLSVGGTTLRPDFRAAITLYHAASEYDVVTVTVLVADAGARAQINPEDAQSDVDGHQVRLATGTTSTVTITVTAADGSATEYVVMIRHEDEAPVFDVAATTLTYVAGASVDETLPAARGGDGELRYTLTDAGLTDAGSTRTLTLPPGLEFDATARRLHGRLTTASSTSRYTLTATDGDRNLSPSDAARTSIAIIVLPDHDANRNGLIEISSLKQLNAIRWDLDGDGVPTATGATPYAAAFPNAGGVVCRATTTRTVSCKGYELVSDLDFNTGDPSTRTDDLYYNADAGWEPVGACDRPYIDPFLPDHVPCPGYAATFSGNGHVIYNLFIRRPGEDYVGLFGVLGSGSRIEGVGLRDVTVSSGKGAVGSLVGVNYEGEIVASYATGAVSGTGYDVGGLVGSNGSTITASYATGAVSGPDVAGGLVGYNWEGEIVASYATGAVGGENIAGGLVGFNWGDTAVRSSYWDTSASGLEWSDGGTGRKTFELRSPTTYTGIYAAWNVDVDGDDVADAPWDFGTSTQYPVLRYGRGAASVALQQSSQPVIAEDGSLRGLSVSGTTLSPDFRATVTSYRTVSKYEDMVTVTALVADAGARTEISPEDAQSDVEGHQVRLAIAAVSTITVTVTAADGSPTEYVVMIRHESAAPLFDAAATTLTYVAGTTVDETLPAARGGDGELRYTLMDALADRLIGALTNVGITQTLVPTLTLPPGLEFDAASRRLHGSPTTASSMARYTLTATDGDDDLSPADAARTSIAIVVSPNHDDNRNGLIEISSLEQLNAIRWDQDGDGVPAEAGAASYAAAFPSAGGVVCRTTTGVVSCKGYELVSDLDFNTGDPSTRTDDLYYNNGAGWEPIVGYAATFRGNGHVIDNLFIRRPGEDRIGLFGFLADGGRIERVGLRGVSVVGKDSVGSLVGVLTGVRYASRTAIASIVSGYATGTVGGEDNVGGLVGSNWRGGEITASYATAKVNGTGQYVGGLVGGNWKRGRIAASYATGAVSGTKYVGGLVGVSYNGGEIAASYATGAVSGTSRVGGLVGGNGRYAEIVASYATGAVSGRDHVGGLAGISAGEIAASYATGAVSGTEDVGGLVGGNGNVRWLSKIETASYWDTLTSGLERSDGGTGKKTFELRSPTTYTGIYTAWNVDVDGDDVADAPWDFGTSTQYPVLRYGHGGASVSSQRPAQPMISADGSLRGLSVSGAMLSPDFRAAVTSYDAAAGHDMATVTAVVADAGARAEISPEDAQSDIDGHQVRLATGAASTVTVTVMAADGSATEYVVMISYEDTAPVFDVAATTLTYVAGASVDETLPAARGGNGELRYTLMDGLTGRLTSALTNVDVTQTLARTLTLPPGLEFDATSHRLHGRLTTASSMARYTLTATDSDGNLAPSDAARTSIAIVVSPDHDGNRNGLIEVSSLEQLNAIRWDLDGNGVPTATGAASYAAAFPSTDGVVCRTATEVVPCKGYELVSDLDFNTGDPSTRTDDLYYNNGAGWEPIGGYAATFRGNGHAIRNLFIRRPSEDRIGLFGSLAGDSRIERVGLRGASVVGNDDVGALAGQAGAQDATGTTIIASHATGAVRGEERIGGLVGRNLGRIAAGYAMATVGGAWDVGGLAGWNSGEIVAGYATGTASGRLNTGGLVGANSEGGTIAASYATGAVGGQSNTGGLVGADSKGGPITASYWDTMTSGRAWSAGGAGRKTFELRSPTTYTGIYAAWNVDVDGDGAADAPWDFGTSTQYPVLRYGRAAASVSRQRPAQPMISADSSLRGLSVSGATLSPDFRAAVTSYRAVADRDVVTVAALVADAGARAEISPRDAQSDVDGHQVRLATDTTDTVTVTVTAADGSATEYVVMIRRMDVAPVFDVAATTLTYVAGASVDETLPAARDGNGELRYTLMDGLTGRLTGALTNVGVTQTLARTLTLPPGLEFNAATRRLHGSLTTASSTLRYTLTAVDGDGNLAPNDAARTSIAIIVLPDHDGNRNALIEISSLEQLNAIRWDLDGDGVPTEAGAASYAAAFPSTDGVVCRTTTSVVPCKGYELISDLDFNTGDPSTRTDDLYYNDGAGWEPIGTCSWWCFASDGYVTTFRGNSHVIDNLFIRRPDEDRIGLFGVLGSGSRIEGVGLRDARVEGDDYVGGLAGLAVGRTPIISTNYVTGAVSGMDDVGGLVGYNNGEITASYATGAVRGTNAVGGLVGFHRGEIFASYATGAVRGRDSVGGLAGRNESVQIAASYATGAVRGRYNVGGLVGKNDVEIFASYATGVVSGTGDVGGLVGDNWRGEIAASYATGAVSGTDDVGGLVGYNNGEITASYATGAVRGRYNIGGFVGRGRGTVTASYWDTLTSGRDSSADGTGKKTFELRSPTTYTGIYAAWNVDVDGDEAADAPWGFGTETEYPILRYGHGTASVALQRSAQPVISADSSLRGLSVVGTTLSPDFRAAVTSYDAASEYDVVTVTALVADAGARAEISPDDAQSDVDGHQVRLAASATGTVTITVTVTAADGSATEYVLVVGHEDVPPPLEDTAPTFEIAATTLTYTAGASVDETLPAARGGDGELRYTLTDGLTDAGPTNAGSTPTLTLTLPPGLEFDAATRRLHGRLTTASSTSRYTLTAVDGDGNLAPSDAARTSIAIVVLPDHDANRNSLIEISSLEQLNAIRWDLDGNGVPTEAGAASYAAAFPSTDGVVCRTTTGVVSCKGYELVSDLDFNTGDPSTRTDDLYYNNGAGWEPVGQCRRTLGWYSCSASDSYAATFRGNGHVIHNLFIRRPGENYVGLFGYLRGGRIEGVGLHDVRVEGHSDVGGLAGRADAWLNFGIWTSITIISNSHVTGVVSGTGRSVGGLVGFNRGEITASYATGVVSGTGRYDAGGLVGDNRGEITASYATGVVSGTDNAGGLVGLNRGEITASYATGVVSGTDNAGGLVGINDGEIAASYATGAVRGVTDVGGLVGFNQGEIVASYATGAVSRTVWYGYVGGLVGYNNSNGKIAASYATGAVRGRWREGGLIGNNGSAVRSWRGTVTASYWDKLTSGHAWSDGGTGKKTFELRAPTTYTGIYAAWNVDVDGDEAADAPWGFGTETEYPILRYGHGTASVALQQSLQPVISADSSLRGLSVVGTTLSPDFRAAVTSYDAASEYDVVTVTVLVADAGARAEISPDDAQSEVDGHQVRLAAGATGTVTITVTVTAADGSATEYVVVVGHEDVPPPLEDTAPTFEIAATTLTYTAGASVDETLPAARGGDGELRYTLTDGLTDAGPTNAGSTPTLTLTLPPGLEFDAATRRLHGSLTTASSTSRYTLTATDGDGNLAPSDAARLSVAIVVLSMPDHDGNRNSLIEISSLEQLNAIRWDLDGNGVPTEAGAASYAAAFPSTDGVVCRATTATVPCKGYELISDLDFNTGDPSTRTDDLYYNNGAGWEPIGTCSGWLWWPRCSKSDGYAAMFSGNGHVIYNLLIQRPGEDNIGLFGVLGIGGKIEEVGLRDVSVVGDGMVGGLTGRIHNSLIWGSWSDPGGEITASYATGVVSGTEFVGGLVGGNNGRIAASSATGAISGEFSVGGLAGINDGEIAASYATGAVRGTRGVGGLVGSNIGEIAASSATGVVSGTDDVGGLMGYSQGDIVASYATGAVRGTRGVGGLVGSKWQGDIAASYATGAVRGAEEVGGLVGINHSGEIVVSYATGAVRGTWGVGGLVGIHAKGRGDGGIAASYATGAVSGARGVGGLVGGSTGEIAASYATGAVSGTDDVAVGGLVGGVGIARRWSRGAGVVWWTGTVTAGYWDTLTSGRGSSAGGTGKKTFELRSPTTYTGIYAAWNVDVDGDEAADAPWGFGTETEYPILRHGHGTASVALQQSLQPVISADSSLRGLSVGGATLSPDFRAAVTSYDAVADRDVVTVAALVAGAGARAEIRPRDARRNVDGHQVRLAAGATGTVTITVTVTAADGSATEYVVAVSREGTAPVFDVAATTLAYVAGDLVDETLPAARGGDGELRYTLTDGLTDAGPTNAGSTSTLTLPLGLEFDAASRRLHGKLTTASSTSRYTLTATDGDGNVSPSDAARTSIEIVVTPDHDRDDDGLISITTLAQLNAVRWDLNGDGVSADPGYAAAFPHAAAGMGCPASGCTGYELDNDLDFDTDGNGTINANDGALSWGAGADAGKGWAPIGGSGSFDGSFRATFMGNGHVVKNLFINRSSDKWVGLFGRVFAGRIEGLGLTGAVVIGDFYVGGLVGYNHGEIIASYANATVSGRDQAGGLVGRNKKKIIASYANATVSGGRAVGGLVGRNKGEIIASYASAAVRGERAVGGLVGRNKRRIAASYARGTVHGRKYVSGLVGRGGSVFSYWDTNVSNLPPYIGGAGRTTGELQTPTSYTGIYAHWNMDLDNSTVTGVGGRDDPWDFGTSSQYPVLQYRGLSTATQFAAQPFGDADLRSLVLSVGVLEPGFDAAITSYAAVVGYAALVGTGHYLTVTASAAHSSASVAFSPADAQASVVGHQVRFESGESRTVAVTVVAADGVTRKIYTVMVAGMPLEGESEPGFAGEITRYMEAMRREAPAPMAAYAVANQMMAHAATATVRAGVFLQGAYNRASGRMKTAYRNLLPTGQPYDDLAPSVELDFAVSEVTRTVVDWVVVELRATTQGIAAATAETRLDRRAALLLGDGSVVGVDADAETAPATIEAGNVVEFSYSQHSTTTGAAFYVLIHHRNHLSVMTTATDGGACDGADYCADFRNGQSWGDGQHDMGNGAYATFAGDTDGDGDIDPGDEAAVRRHNLTTINGTGRYTDGAVDGDLNFDGDVLSDDRYFILRNNARRACDVCSP